MPFSRAKRSLQLTAMVLLTLLATLTPRSATAEASRVVLVLAEAKSTGIGMDTHLLGALRAQLSELQVDVLVVRRPQQALASAARRAQEIASKEQALGVIWLELRPDRLSVFLYDSSGHLYARDVEPDGSTVSQSEAIAIVLRSAIAAMLEGDAVSMTEVRLPPPSPSPTDVPAASPPPPREPAARAAYVRVGLSYVGGLFARRAPWQHGAAATLMAGPTGSPLFFGLDYTQFPPIELESNDVETRVQRHPAEAFAGLQLRLAQVLFSVQGAFSADYTVRTTERVGEGLVAAPAGGRWLWAVSTRLGVMVPASNRISGVLNVGADFLLNPFHQVVGSTNTVNQVVGSPLLARPRLELGAMISVW